MVTPLQCGQKRCVAVASSGSVMLICPVTEVIEVTVTLSSAFLETGSHAAETDLELTVYQRQP